MIVSNGAPTVIPSTLADTTPMLAGGNYWPTTTLELSGRFATYGAMYRAQLWVYTLVRKVAVGAARLPFNAYEGGQDAPAMQAPTTPLAQLFARPNALMSPNEFWTWTVATFEINGESLWWKIRDVDRRVRELWPLHPSMVDIQMDPDGSLWYQHMAGVRAGSPLPRIPASDIVHFKSFNPDTVRRGMSFQEPLRQTLLAEDAGRRAQAALFNNGSRPSVLLTHPSTVSDAAGKRLVESWDNIHSGVDSWAKTAILEEGMLPVPIQMSMEELQYIESRKLSREECCAAADIPPPVVHILDHATFSNITEQMRSMYRDTMTPRLGVYESTVNHQLVPDFARTDSGTFTKFDLSEVLAGDRETLINTNAVAINSAQMTPREARKSLHLPPVEGDEILLISATTVPIEDAGLVKKFPTPDLPAPPVPAIPGVTQPANATAKSLKVTVDMVRSRIIGGRSPDVWLKGVDDAAICDLVTAGTEAGHSPDVIETWLKTLETA